MCCALASTTAAIEKVADGGCFSSGGRYDNDDDDVGDSDLETFDDQTPGEDLGDFEGGVWSRKVPRGVILDRFWTNLATRPL